MANRELVKQIKAVFHTNLGVYGSPRVYRELLAQGVACSENRVARLMCLQGIRAKQSRRFKATTKRDKAHPVAPNLLNQEFKADRPDQKWLADITYIRTQEGWLYLAAILDLYSRRIVGWAMSDRMTSDLTRDSMLMALWQRRPSALDIHHSDQGSQYTAAAYQELLQSNGIRASMNGVQSWYDNAPMESFIGTLKCELTHHRRYRSRDEARTDVFKYIESFYNLRRLHSSLDYLSPDDYERLYYKREQELA
jgi:transposase InsO family protein